MRRHRGISAEELNQITKLKEAGASWLRIQQETGVPRRSGKLAYEKWQQSQSMEELKEARVNVATELFKSHIHALVNLAGYLTENLAMPPSTQAKAEDFLTSLLENEITGQPSFYDLPQTNDRHRRKSTLRNNRLLLKALQEHTRENVRWGTLNDWKTAWDDFKELFGDIRKLTSLEVGKITKDRKEIFTRIEHDGGNTDAFGCIVDTIVEGARYGAMENDFGLDEPLVKIGLVNNASAVITRVENKEIFKFTEQALAEEVLDIFDTANTTLRVMITMTRGNAIREAVNKMQLAIEELDNMLNPVALYPILLRTRCDYCPV